MKITPGILDVLYLIVIGFGMLQMILERMLTMLETVCSDRPWPDARMFARNVPGNSPDDLEACAGSRGILAGWPLR